MPIWLQAFQGLLTPLIAVITTYIAWQQWRATRLKMNMERYERRLAIYQAAHKFISMVISDLKPEVNDLFDFYSATAEADFLFPSSIRQYLDDLFSHANHLHRANSQYRDYTQTPPANYDHQKICDEIDEHTRWFTDQPKIAKDLFQPFLNITQ